jgi:hypothetical protein
VRRNPAAVRDRVVDHGDRAAIGEHVLGGKNLLVRQTLVGGGLSIATAAEGVETAEQFELLADEGCTEAQGSLFSPPRPAAEINTWLASLPWRSAKGR